MTRIVASDEDQTNTRHRAWWATSLSACWWSGSERKQTRVCGRTRAGPGPAPPRPRQRSSAQKARRAPPAQGASSTRHGLAGAFGVQAGNGPSLGLSRKVLRRFITLTGKGIGRQVQAWRPVLAVEQLPVDDITPHPGLGHLVERALADPARHKLLTGLARAEERCLLPLRHLPMPAPLGYHGPLRESRQALQQLGDVWTRKATRYFIASRPTCRV